jgi:hypothetical protein
VANLTLSIDDDLLKAARQCALEQDTSVNSLVRDFLEQMTQFKSRKDAATQRLLTTNFGYKAGSLDRDSLYDR